MALRCFLFSTDEGTSEVIRQVLPELGVEGESCSEAATAVVKIAKESFQLVVVDWDHAESTSLMSAARDRKAAERPLVLAIVSDDASVPKALQSGANSILRRPILVNQVKDTLTTARDLLRARTESRTAVKAAAAAAGAFATATPASNAEPAEKAWRAGEFLSATPPAPGAQYDTESEQAGSAEDSAAESLRRLRDLEPVTTSVPAVLPPPAPEEPRTLEELLRSRGVKRQAASAPSQAGGTEKPDMLGYDQTTPYADVAAAPARAKEPKNEPALFSYVSGESEEPKEASPSRFRLSKKAIIFAACLAGGAVALTPQAPWHQGLKMLWSRGQHSLHVWLNPQPVTTPVAPAAHEDFGRAGDEYKLPVAETIPDATTDPSKINVVPIVDPTAKKPNGDTSQDQAPAADQQTAAPADGTQAPAMQTPVGQPPLTTSATTQTVVPSAPAITAAPAAAPVSLSASTAPANTTSGQTSAVTYPPVTPTSAPPKSQPAPYVPPPAPRVPSSLKSQMATMVPEASGNKAPETALPSIEPVVVAEATERALITDQPLIVAPAAAGNQHGTVSLQVLIGRDGLVQDAKFFQGSLVFARAAIDGVKQWRFKPYIINGRPVSVQTTLTVKFPAQ